MTVYGPPEMMNGDTSFDPEANQNEDVYGPPEMFDGSETDDGAVESASIDEQDVSK